MLNILSFLMFFYYFSVAIKCPVGSGSETNRPPISGPGFVIQDPWIRIPKKYLRIHNTAAKDRA